MDHPQQATKKTSVRSLLTRLLLSMGLAFLFVYLAKKGGMPLVPSAASWRHVSWPAFTAFALLYVATHFVRATRWRHLIEHYKRVPFWEGVWLNWIGFFAIFALPLRLGEFARPALSKLRLQIPISVGLGTVASERVIDGLVASAFVLWGIWLPHLPSEHTLVRSLPYYGTLASLVFTGAFVVLLIFLWRKQWALGLVRATLGKVSERMSTLLVTKLTGLAVGLESLTKPKPIAFFTAETLLYWSLNVLSMWVLAIAIGLPLELHQSFGVMGVLAIGILLPAGPGLFGSFQLFTFTGLRLFVPEELISEQGALYVFLLYCTQALIIVAFGLVPFGALRLNFETLWSSPTNDSIPPPAGRA